MLVPQSGAGSAQDVKYDPPRDMSITCKISTCVIEGFGRGYSIQFYFRSR
jgi:hypothetical protein